ncbi:MAG: ADP-glyceromanno-heptose 6-epimerase [Planctomycetota bacterium]|nr:MAG: ADP-glyceromanno-heptose 6-epimerase [Planctomycetota bacterium]
MTSPLHLVTGAAGFVGRRLAAALSARGARVVAVDDLADPAKRGRLEGLGLVDALDRRELADRLAHGRFDLPLGGVFHQGATADTLSRDPAQLYRNNLRFSLALCDHALARRIPFVYASSAAVYGAAGSFARRPRSERPLNLYARTKLALDHAVRRRFPCATSPLVGLRYFNVYGPGEDHKGRMASMVHRAHRQLTETGVLRLFAGGHGLADGEQRRDFVHVDDVVAVNLFFAERPTARGLFDVGSGRSRSFNELARLLIARLGRGRVVYVPIPTQVAGRYQTFTQADLRALRRAGYARPFLSLEEGLARTFGPPEATGAQAVA